MVARKGYKLTEVGEIPEDWEIVPLGSIATFRTGPFGSALHKTDYVFNGVPVINPMQIVDGKIRPTLSMAVSIDTLQRLSEFILEKEDIVLGRRGEMGRCAVVDDISAGWLCGTGSLIIRTQDINNYFLFRILSSKRVINDLETSSIGTTMTNLNQDILGNLQIQRPPTLKEQTAIATALSDADALIEALELSITKKRHIKQGAMQELLTGKKRLPGFEGEWERKNLESCVGTASGGTPARTNTSYFLGNIPWVTTSELNDTYIKETNECISEQGLANSAAKIFPKQTVLMAMYGATIGKLGIILESAATNQACCAFLCDEKEVHHKWLYYYLLNKRVEIVSLGCGAGQPNISQEIIKKICLLLPTLAEQTAIAAVLTDMDEEIAALEAKLTKARQIKAGMMQELLTGRIRLV